MYYYISPSSNDLVHHGVLGMKWGVRRYQNKDGSLTAAGRRHYSKELERVSTKARDDLQRNYDSLYVKSYNRLAKDANREGGYIDQFNKTHKNPGSDEYVEAFNKFYGDKLDNYLSQDVGNFLRANKNWQEAQRIMDKYGMMDWDDLAKQNRDFINSLDESAKKAKG